MRRRHLLVRGASAATIAAGLAGCAPPQRLQTVPATLRLSRPWPDMPEESRVILDGDDGTILAGIIRQSLQRELAWLDRTGRKVGPADYLALSGGGADGAFGAGILTGWTALGTRPEFRVVTGVSTGALTAPFAFLGPTWDRELEWGYTRITQDRVMRPRGYVAALVSDSLYDSAPLEETIRRALTPALIEGIARASKEQASGIEEVSDAVRKLDSMTQHNAALVEETNAALAQAEAQATELDRVVEGFTLQRRDARAA